jgi:hypothetical protein
MEKEWQAITRRELVALMVVIIFTAGATAQTTLAAGSGSQPKAKIAIESVSAPASNATSGMIKVIITNDSDWLLGKEHSMEFSPLRFEIRDENGKAALETEYGCKFHHSSEGCQPITRTHDSALVVVPGERIEYTDDLSKEYFLDSRHTYSFAALGERFVLVNVPKSRADSLAHRFGIIMNYRYLGNPYKELDVLRSNTIKIGRAR